MAPTSQSLVRVKGTLLFWVKGSPVISEKQVNGTQLEVRMRQRRVRSRALYLNDISSVQLELIATISLTLTANRKVLTKVHSMLLQGIRQDCFKNEYHAEATRDTDIFRGIQLSKIPSASRFRKKRRCVTRCQSAWSNKGQMGFIRTSRLARQKPKQTGPFLNSITFCKLT